MRFLELSARVRELTGKGAGYQHKGRQVESLAAFCLPLVERDFAINREKRLTTKKT